MPTAANITVKKSDGTTDIVWTLVSASGGDKSPAMWRSQTATGTLGQKPTFWMSSKNNQAGDVRRVDVQATFPAVYTNTSTGQTEVRAKMTFQGSFAIPQNIASTDIGEFTYQVCNLVAAQLTKDSVYAGFAPT
jgi:hypothetical protein